MKRASPVVSSHEKRLDVDAFQRQLVELLPRLRRFGRALAGGAADADDLVQVAVERALARRDRWRPDTRLDCWVMRIMKNAWIDEVRARNRRGRLSGLAEESERVADPASDPFAHETAMTVEWAMTRLPDDQRIAVALVLLEGLSYAEAAETLEIPAGTLTSRLVRGRTALMAMLQENGVQP